MRLLTLSLALLLGAWTACDPEPDWLAEVDTLTWPGMLAVLDEASLDRVNAILQDEQDPTWRDKLASGEWTDDPEGLKFWRRVARADVTTPLTDAEAAYLEHSRDRVADFQAALLSENNDPVLRKLLETHTEKPFPGTQSLLELERLLADSPEHADAVADGVLMQELGRYLRESTSITDLVPSFDPLVDGAVEELESDPETRGLPNQETVADIIGEGNYGLDADDEHWETRLVIRRFLADFLGARRIGKDQRN